MRLATLQRGENESVIPKYGVRNTLYSLYIYHEWIVMLRVNERDFISLLAV